MYGAYNCTPIKSFVTASSNRLSSEVSGDSRDDEIATSNLNLESCLEYGNEYFSALTRADLARVFALA